MANTKIDVNKREDALVQTTVKDVNQDKVNAIVKFFKLLLNDTEKFNEKAAAPLWYSRRILRPYLDCKESLQSFHVQEHRS